MIPIGLGLIMLAQMLINAMTLLKFLAPLMFFDNSLPNLRN